MKKFTVVFTILLTVILIFSIYVNVFAYGNNNIDLSNSVFSSLENSAKYNKYIKVNEQGNLYINGTYNTLGVSKTYYDKIASALALENKLIKEGLLVLDYSNYGYVTDFDLSSYTKNALGSSKNAFSKIENNLPNKLYISNKTIKHVYSLKYSPSTSSWFFAELLSQNLNISSSENVELRIMRILLDIQSSVLKEYAKTGKGLTARKIFGKWIYYPSN